MSCQLAFLGKNDDIFDRLPQRFTLKQAQQEREDHDYDRTRSMVKNWKRANLVKSIDTATYEKNPETWNVVSGKG